uniref:Small ribosomal subunit protein cS22 n=1 Tax=Araucaria cunninghamii TaxID=56994 RepID=A0A0D6R1W4_ARACU
MAAAYLSITSPTVVGVQNSCTRPMTVLPFARKSTFSIPISCPSLFSALKLRQNKRVFRITAQVQEVLQSTSKQAQLEKKLYVGNIPRTVNNEELAKIFGECGTVEKAEVMYDKYTKKSRRFGFVTMSTVEEAQAAAENMNGTEIGGRQIKVNITEKPLDTSALDRLAEEDNFIDSSYKAYIGNLAKTVTAETLKKKFSEKAKVLDAKVPCSPETGKSLGYGFVSFSSEDDMDVAIACLNDIELEGRRIRVNVA